VSQGSPDAAVDMLLGLESQPTPTIALLVFVLCYALAAIVFIAAATISRRPSPAS
jgi:hypothetical protein